MHAVMPHGARTPVDMWTTQERCPHTHSATINNKHQLDCFRRPGLRPSASSPGDLGNDASPGSSAILARIWTAIHTSCFANSPTGSVGPLSPSFIRKVLDV